MKTDTLASFAQLPTPEVATPAETAATPAPVQLVDASADDDSDSDGDSDGNNESANYRAHDDGAAPAETVKKKQGRKLGETYDVTQRVDTLLRVCPNLKVVPFMVSNKVPQTEAEIIAAIGKAVAEKQPLTPEFLASLAERETGGKMTLTKMQKEFGGDFVVTLPKREIREWAERFIAHAWGAIKPFDSEGINPATNEENGIFTDENDPSIIRDAPEVETAPAS